MSGARGGGLRPGRDFWTKEAYARPVTRRTACMLVAGVICLLTAAPPASARYIRLSDERTRTYSAFLDYPTPVRVKPGLRARKLTSLTPFTYHGRHEVVLVLGRLRTARRTWVRIRYPGLGRRVGWVTDRVLSASRLHRDLIVVDREALELRLLHDGKLAMRVQIGVGAAESPTPTGRSYIRERLALPTSTSIYGPLAFGTSAFSRYRTDWPGGGQVGIHGTNQAGLIPGYISNGCVRLRNEDILALGRRIELGTPVLFKSRSSFLTEAGLAS
jgi:hypothetical protein